MSGKKILLIVLGVVVVVALVLVVWLKDTSTGTPVFAEKATGRKLTETVSASGRVQPKTKVNITSEINAEIIHLAVREGDRMRMGQLLIVLDTVQAQADADQAKYAVSEINARLDGALSTLNQNREEFDRQQRLFDSKLTSETAYKNARYAFESAQSTYEATKAQAKQLQARYEQQLDKLAKTKIVAPMPGVVTYVDCEVGEIAAAQTAFTQGKTLMTIADLDVFEVEVEVDETEINKVRLGQDAEIEVDAFPDTTFSGEVAEIGNTAILAGLGTTEQSTNFNVKVVFMDSNIDIRPGMSATVDITTRLEDEALSIPFSAVVMRTYDLDSLERARQREQTEGGGVHAAEGDPDSAEAEDEKEREELKGVFVLREGKARFVQVETGIADQKHIQITTGLEQGDSVISGPYRILRTINDGQAVRVREREVGRTE